MLITLVCSGQISPVKISPGLSECLGEIGLGSERKEGKSRGWRKKGRKKDKRALPRDVLGRNKKSKSS